jgi:hypothetical protein
LSKKFARIPNAMERKNPGRIQKAQALRIASN